MEAYGIFINCCQGSVDQNLQIIDYLMINSYKDIIRSGEGYKLHFCSLYATVHILGHVDRTAQ